MKQNYETPVRRRMQMLALVASIGLAGIAGSDAVGAVQQPDGFGPNRSADVADTQSVRPRPTDIQIEALRLRCDGRVSNDRSGVVCEWSEPTSDRAASVRLLRIRVGSGQGREVVYRSSNLEITEYLDAPLRPENRYVYAVQALGRTGRVVGQSRPVVVGIPADARPSKQVLRLNCSIGDASRAAERIGIGCEWSLPREGTARVLTLWRSVDGAARERVASFERPFKTGFRDVVPGAAYRVRYSVVATDGGGKVVAQSRPVTIAIAHTPTPVPARPAPIVEPPLVVAAEPVAAPEQDVPTETAPEREPSNDDQRRDDTPERDVVDEPEPRDADNGEAARPDRDVPTVEIVEPVSTDQQDREDKTVQRERAG